MLRVAITLSIERGIVTSVTIVDSKREFRRGPKS
jgi:hypothetical protein